LDIYNSIPFEAGTIEEREVNTARLLVAIADYQVSPREFPLLDRGKNYVKRFWSGHQGWAKCTGSV